MNVNPYDVISDDMPLIVLSDKTNGLIEFLIKMRTEARYNHIMILHRSGYFATQNNVFKEVPVRTYMKPTNRLKFVKVKDLTPEAKRAIMGSIHDKLKLPWWKRRYDWVGIVGQIIGIKKLNLKNVNYCSEDVAHHLKAALPHISPNNRQVIEKVPDHGNPADLNHFFKQHIQIFETVGYWEG